MSDVSIDSPMTGTHAYIILRSMQYDIGQDSLEEALKYLTHEDLDRVWETVLAQTKGFVYDRIELDDAVPVSVNGRVSIIRKTDVQEALAFFVQAVAHQIEQAKAMQGE